MSLLSLRLARSPAASPALRGHLTTRAGARGGGVRTEQVIYLKDGDVVCISKDKGAAQGGAPTFSHTISNLDKVEMTREIITLELKRSDIERGGLSLQAGPGSPEWLPCGLPPLPLAALAHDPKRPPPFACPPCGRPGHKHFMIKEIMDQPRTLSNCMRGRIDLANNDIVLGGLAGEPWNRLSTARRIVICACGTSWHAGLVGEYLIEQLARVQCDVEYASEFRYKKPVLNGKDDVIMVISQSGETADTLAAVREAKENGCMASGRRSMEGWARDVHGWRWWLHMAS